MNKQELEAVIEKHVKWLNDEVDGVRANLTEADLRGADLTEANLTGARIFNATGDGVIIRSMQLPRYTVNVCDDWLQIGCEGHRLHEWEQFDDETINGMDSGALEWRQQHKRLVLLFAEADLSEEA